MKKLIAGFMTALMALLPLVSAAQLGNYPAILEDADGVLDAIVVVGADAKPSDVVGAVDLAVRLAEVGKTAVSQACSGASADVNGVRKDTINLPSTASGTGLGDSSAFPASGVLKTFHYTGLKDSHITWRSDEYDYHEQVSLAAAEFRHDFQDNKVNGTETLVINSGDIWYDFVFDEALNLGAASSAGTIASPDYTYPINIELLGKPFQIVGLGTNQMKMLAGSVGTATATTPVVNGDYSVYSDLGSNGAWARVIIKDADDNTVDTLTINQGSSKDSSATGLTVQITAVRALMDGTIVGSDIVVGLTADGTTKTYDASADVTSTTNNDRYPGETDWGIQVVVAASAANITANDYIRVIYKPTSKQYLKAGDKIEFPNNYADLGFEGWNTDKWTTITLEPVSGVTGYDKDADTTSYGNLNGIKIVAAESGSIMTPSGNAFTTAYILFNATQAAGTSAPIMIGYYDTSKSKVLVDPDAAATDEYGAEVLLTAGTTTFNYQFTMNYGGVGDSSYALWFNYTEPFNVTNLGTTGGYDELNINLGTKVVANYRNTSAWTTSNAPEWRLGSSDNAQTTDVNITAAGEVVNAGIKSADIVGDQGLILVAPEANAGANKVVVNVPSKDLKIKAYFGKLGEGVSGNEVTYDSYPSIPITTAVAKLDSEVTAADKIKNMISVGGPAVNMVTADALGLEYPTNGITSTIPENKGLIKVVDSPYEEGADKVIVVVAGWEAEHTRVAASVLQKYHTKLSGVTASEVEVSGSVGSPTVTEV